jgi:hypothetical protein
MSDQFRTVEAVVCQISTTVNSNSWTYLPWLEVMSFEQGSGQIFGSATFRQFAGVRTAINQGSMQQVAELPGFGDPSGKLIRILKRDDSSGTVSLDGKKFTPVWYGQITSRAIALEGKTNAQNGATYEYQAIGIISMLDQISITNGFYGKVPVEYCPAFNSGIGTYRSTVSSSVGPGGNAFTHSADGEILWTALDILEYLIRVHCREKYDINDPDNCLDYTPAAVNFNGATIFQALTALAGPRRGLTFTADVINNKITITVRSTSAVAISVGTFTLNQASLTHSITVSGNPFYQSPVIAYDYSNVYDEIEIVGAHPICVVTIGPPHWLKGWSTEDELAWEDDPTNATYAHVFRRFLVKNDWNGKSFDSTQGVRDLLNLSISGSYGYNGRSGERFFGDAGGVDIIPPAIYQTERTIPFPPNFASTQFATKSGALVFMKPDDSYIDVVNELKWGVTLSEGPLALVIEDGKNGLNIFQDNPQNYLYATFSVREPKPLKVSWIRAVGEQPRTEPRKKTIHMPQAEQWYVCSDCYLAIDENGAPITYAGDQYARDDIPLMREMLALYRNLYGRPRVNFSIRNRAIVDNSPSTAPGALITTIVTGDQSHKVNGTVTRRRYSRVNVDGVGRWDTTIEGETVVPDLEATL